MPKKQRHKIMRPIKGSECPLTRTKFKYAKVRRLGFKVSRKLWSNCVNPNERNKGKNI